MLALPSQRGVHELVRGKTKGKEGVARMSGGKGGKGGGRNGRRL